MGKREREVKVDVTFASITVSGFHVLWFREGEHEKEASEGRKE